MDRNAGSALGFSELRGGPRDDEVNVVLDEIPQFKGTSCEVTTLGGGITNRNCRIDAGGESVVRAIAILCVTH